MRNCPISVQHFPHSFICPIQLSRVAEGGKSKSHQPPVEYTLLGLRTLDKLPLRLLRRLLLPLLRTFLSTTTSSRPILLLLLFNELNRYISRIVPKKVPRMAPARVPPEYWPEQDGEELVTMVVVACLATSTGVTASRADAGFGWGDCQTRYQRFRLSHNPTPNCARTMFENLTRTTNSSLQSAHFQ